MGTSLRKLNADLLNNANTVNGIPLKVSNMAILTSGINEIDDVNDGSLVILGDSRAQRNSQAGSWDMQGDVIVGNILAMQKFNILGVYGFSGFTIEQIAAFVPKVISLNAKNCVIYAGGNNIPNDYVQPNAAQFIFDKLISLIIKPLREAGILCYVVTIAPFTGFHNQQQAVLCQINDLIRRESFQRTGFYCIDLYETMVDSQLGLIRSTLSTDLVHNNTRGGLYGGLAFAKAVLQIPFNNDGIKSGGRDDPYILSANPMAVGTNASGTNKWTDGTGASGTGPNSWGGLSNNADTTVVFTGGQSRLDWIDGQGLQFAITFGADDRIVSIGCFPAGGTSTLKLATAWSAGASRSYGELVTRSNGVRDFQFRQIANPSGNGGTTAGSEPIWPTTIGDIVIDNTCIWMCIADPIGNSYELIADIVFTASNGVGILPTLSLNIDDAGFSGTLRGSILNNGIWVPATSATIQSPIYNGAENIWDGQVPLNQVMRLRSQPMLIPPLAVNLKPQIRINGKNTATCTGKVFQFEMRQCFPVLSM